jgi:uncharacterized protein (TIGR03790 family)
MRKRSRLLLLICVLGLVSAGCSHAGGGPKNVLLVVNDNSLVSVSICAYYKSKRRIPDRNVCHIRCSTDESVSKTECETNIVAPIRSFIETTGIHNRIDYIVLTKGVPLKASYSDTTWYGPASVASILTCVGAPTITTPSTNPYGPTAYPAPPAQYFTHQLTFSGKNYYIVARLDAYNEAQVHRMIDDSLNCAGRTGQFVLDGRPEADPNSYNGKANARIRQANHDLLGAGYSTYYNDTTFDSMISEFVGGRQNVMGYFSWGSTEASYTLANYMSNCFVPGSIADTYVSTSARSFAYPPSYGQSLMADLIPQGLSGTNGYVSEPDIRYATYPNTLFSRYTSGYNMGESFLAATPRLYWKACIIGDPLMAPYATPPVVTITSPDPARRLTRQQTVISADATDASGIKKVEFYVDDVLVATADVPPYEYAWDTTGYADGSVHTVDVIAYENSGVFTQGMASAQYQMLSTPTDVTTISQLAGLPDDTLVQLDSKVAIAGTDAFTDGAFVAEANRTAGIHVVGQFTANTGALVNIEGELGTAGGERVIVASSVWGADPLQGTGDALRPFAAPNRSVANQGTNSGSEYSALVTGLSNTCRLVTTTGRVTKIDADGFSISDGSMSAKSIPTKEIKISLRNMVSPALAPPLNSYVIITGVSCYILDGGLWEPCIRPRSSSDIFQVI